jgi:hypothetical protein
MTIKEFWITVREAETSREFLLSTHPTLARARARIRWHWRKKYPLSQLKIIEINA